MEYNIGIASYKRAESQHTLGYLESIGIPKSKIYMAVQTEEDFATYIEAGIGDRVSKIIFKPQTSASGNRNTLITETDPKTPIILIDDDVKEIGILKNKKLEKVSTEEQFDHMVETGIKLCKKHNTVGFGLYPVYNAYFMSNKYTKTNICDAGLFGLLSHEYLFNEALRTKEDYELCCRIIKRFGAFVRMNNYAVKTPAGHSKGGCKEAWNDKEDVVKTARTLVRVYPDILKLNPKKQGEVMMRGAKEK